MATAGYSGTPLLKKLGIKEEMKVLLFNEPPDYYTLLDKNISSQLCRKNDVPDFIHLFAKSQLDFHKSMQKVLAVAEKNKQVIVWVSWYKKSAGITTDMTEDVIRNYALQNGLVDVKVCAVSELWSGLKLVVPLAKR
jgi:hypothetical protein